MQYGHLNQFITWQIHCDQGTETATCSKQAASNIWAANTAKNYLCEPHVQHMGSDLHFPGTNQSHSSVVNKGGHLS